MSGLVTYFIKNTACIIAQGNDRIDFFNRMSTNDFSKMDINEYRHTVFTNEKGRIIDFVNILNFEIHSLLFCSPDNTEKLTSHLNKYIIADDISFEVSNHVYKRFSFYSDNSEKIIKSLFGTEVDENKFAITEKEIFVYCDNYRINSAEVMIPIEKVTDFEKNLSEYTRLDSREYEFFRIKNCIAEDSRELNDEINPLEILLRKYISFTKGCYIGQEVIARLDAQNKVPKQVVFITSGNEIISGIGIYAGMQKTDCGFISSVVQSDNKWYGLGFIKSVSIEEGQEYFSGAETEYKINIQKFI